MDLSNLNDARGVVSTGRKQDQILQEVRKLHQAPDPRRQCPFCGGTLAGGFVKCKNCASDITWVEGWPRKPGNTRSWLGGWKRRPRGKGAQQKQPNVIRGNTLSDDLLNLILVWSFFTLLLVDVLLTFAV